MTTESEVRSIHARKRYCVVLDGFDPNNETADSFAMKLALKTKTPIPRVRNVLRGLPYPLRAGLTSTQANRLKNVIESVGGRVHLETHIVTPTSERSQGDAASPGDVAERVTRPSARPRQTKVVARERAETRRCPECGWEGVDDATHCELCLTRLDGKGEAPAFVTGELPDVNPLSSDSDPLPLRRRTPHYVFAFLILALATIVVLLLTK